MKTCYIFSAGEGLPENFRKSAGDLVIAADAGYNHLKKLGIAPDIILGDFDSLNYIPNICEIIKHPKRKDDTDTVLAVKTGFERGYSRFIIYGGLGGRLDHTLANIQTLNFIAKNSGTGFICGGGLCITSIKNRKIKFKAKESGNISVFSAGSKAVGVGIKGLLYELEDAEITCDFPLGVSNEFIGKESVISVSVGTLNIIFGGTPDDIINLS